ncbi:MAG: hypothetical protein NZO58_08775, partial [Gemmataceae bacterium]|nr:hypothetical protein [Gemmataceae bacterium]
MALESTTTGAPKNWARCCLAAVAVAGLFAWHGWLTLGLFGDSYPWPNLTNEEPVLSGRHPQHQYLGCIGAEAIAKTGRPCAYVPDFQAGFPKTPIFNGSRLAEVFYYLGGIGHSPRAYKIGLALTCLLVPLLVALAARGMGLDWASTFVATTLGILIWWGPQCRAALEAGEADLQLAALAVLAHVGALVRFDRRPGFWAWWGVWFTSALAWFFQPLVLPISLTLVLVYYLGAGVRHAHWTWHLALITAEAGAVAVHVPWLIDWVEYWWLRLPLPSPNDLLPHRTFQTIWNAPLWCGAAERLFAVLLLGAAVPGLLILYARRCRPTARLLGLGTAGLMSLTLLGIAWEPLGQVGTAAFLAPALWFAALLASLSVTTLPVLLWRRP